VRFWIPWWLALAVSATVLVFFVDGLVDGSVSSGNVGLWAMMLGAATGVTAGSLWLKKAGRPFWAVGVASLLAVPGLLAVVFLLVVLMTNQRWN
jgi:hypothetical protein